jgi:tetratricopeptide (TPR) repeat protein
MSKRLLRASITAAVLTLTGLSPASAQHPPDLPLDPRPVCTPFDYDPVNGSSNAWSDEEPSEAPAPTITAADLGAALMRVCQHVWEAVAGGRDELDVELNIWNTQESDSPGPVIGPVSPLKFDPSFSFTPSKEDLFGPAGVEPPQQTGGGCLTHEQDACWLGMFFVPCDETASAARQVDDVKRLFMAGERCRLRGDYDMAHNCYREILRMSPHGAIADLARTRIQDLRSMDDLIEGVADEETEPTTDGTEAESSEDQALSREADEFNAWMNEMIEALAHHLRMEEEALRAGSQHDGPSYEQEEGDCPCCPFAYMMKQQARIIHELDLQRLKDARDLYEIGERCRRNGDPDMASRFYKEAIEAHPASPFAHKATARIARMALRRHVEPGATEESETPAPRPRRELQMLPQWCPLVPPVAPEVGPTGPASPLPSDDELSIKRAQELRERSGQLTDSLPNANDDRQSMAAKVFQVAEDSVSAGQLDTAYALFQQVHLICPDCKHGRRAIERMAEIERQRASKTPAEEQESPRDEDIEYREILKLVKKQLPSNLMFGIDRNADDVLSRIPSPSNGNDTPAPPTDRIQLEIIEALDRVLQETTEAQPKITITEDESSTPAPGDDEEEEEEEPLPNVDRSAPVYVPADPRRLRLVEDDDCCADMPAACLDMSDWLRQVTAGRPSGVHLRIDAARLGRLLAEGEDAVRRLGCELVSDGDGRSFVVYPASGRK